MKNDKNKTTLKRLGLAFISGSYAAFVIGGPVVLEIWTAVCAIMLLAHFLALALVDAF